LAFITETGYTPGVTCWAAAAQLSTFGGQRSKLSGTVNPIVVPAVPLSDVDARFLIYPLPNFTVFPVGVNLSPVIVTEVPTGPEDGKSDEIVGDWVALIVIVNCRETVEAILPGLLSLTVTVKV